MYRTHTNGQLRLDHLHQTVKLCGWVQTIRDKGFVIWIDLRDRYGISQLVLDESRTSPALMAKARELGREFVII
jgi:aspartyl-tRNA synthetase